MSVPPPLISAVIELLPTSALTSVAPYSYRALGSKQAGAVAVAPAKAPGLPGPGEDALGEDALGEDALGEDALGEDALGEDAGVPANAPLAKAGLAASLPASMTIERPRTASNHGRKRIIGLDTTWHFPGARSGHALGTGRQPAKDTRSLQPGEPACFLQAVATWSRLQTV